MNSISKATESIYSDASNFLLIGFTGRTGSGCSTAAKFLTLDNPGIPSVFGRSYQENEERKYRILSKYATKEWEKFTLLKVSVLIAGTLLTHPIESLINFCVEEVDGDKKDKIREGLKSLDSEFNKTKKYYDEYILANSQNESLVNCVKRMKCAYDYYDTLLPAFSESLKRVLNDIQVGIYTKLFQKIGDNYRASGEPYLSDFNSNDVYSLSKLIHKAIKSIKTYKMTLQKPCFIVVDAIRNPYEGLYLKSRYANFYMVSVNTSNDKRQNYLQSSHKFDTRVISELDNKEYPDSLKGHEKFTSQNIQKCIEMSDIHINNSRESAHDVADLYAQLIWYFALMRHPGLVMPTAIESCMQIAYTAKTNSGCISRQVGAVVTDSEHSVKAVGWNSTPKGQVPCLLRNVGDLLTGNDKSAFSDFEKNDKDFGGMISDKYKNLIPLASEKGINLSYCFKTLKNEIDGKDNQVHTRSLHAEENAFLQIVRNGGVGVKGGILFTTASPCELCSKKAYQLGISKIIYIDPYPGISSSHILKSGSNNPELELFRGAVGTAFHRLYQPFMPFKDEISLRFFEGNSQPERPDEISQLKNQIADLKRLLNSRDSRISELEVSLQSQNRVSDLVTVDLEG